MTHKLRGVRAEEYAYHVKLCHVCAVSTQ